MIRQFLFFDKMQDIPFPLYGTRQSPSCQEEQDPQYRIYHPRVKAILGMHDRRQKFVQFLDSHNKIYDANSATILGFVGSHHSLWPKKQKLQKIQIDTIASGIFFQINAPSP